MADFFSDLIDNAGVSLSRRIDNELNSDFLPAPQVPSNETPKVQTSNDKTGVNKEAGSGAQIIKGVNNKVLFGGGALVLGLVVYMAVK